MKKTTRSLLITALILFCSGLLLAICSSLYAKIAKIEVFDAPKKAKTIETVTISLEEILSASPESNFVKKLSATEFTSVEIHSFAGNVEICSGAEKTELSLDKANTNNLEFAIVGDTLTISEVDAVGFMGFYIDRGGLSFKGLRHIFHPGNPMNSRKAITLNLAEGFALSEVDISSSVGDVRLDGISASVVNIDSSSGKVNLENLSNDSSKITVNGNFTDIEMDNNRYSSCAVSTHFGNIKTHLLQDTNASTILDLWCGDIEVETDLPTSFYKLSLSTTSGKIHRNSEEVGKKLNEDGTGSSRISSGILIGDFTLDFTGENEESFVSSDSAPEQTPSTSEAPADQQQN